MQEAVLGFMISSMHEYFTGINVGNLPVPVADGFFTLRVPDISDRDLVELAHLMERDDLVQDPRFVTAPARRQHQTELEALIKAWALGKTRQELWDDLAGPRLLWRACLSTREVLEDPHIKARQAFIERDHPTAGPTTLLAPWIHLSKTPASIATMRQPSANTRTRC